MTYNRFQGDPAIKITENGATIEFIGGQPIMDQGLNNAVLISLFTKNGWWGNVLEKDENKKIGSEYEKQRTIIDIKTINDIRDAAEKALQWMKNIKLSSKIDVSVSNPISNQIFTKITIHPPGTDKKELLFIKNGLNWISQAINPAHERFKNVI